VSRTRSLSHLSLLAVLAGAVACQSSTPAPHAGTGGQGSGGLTSTGGRTGTGGANSGGAAGSATTGAAGTSTGGAPGTGGNTATGGAAGGAGSGGKTGAGGGPATGGSNASGGATVSTGGAAGSTTNAGGSTSASGGAGGAMGGAMGGAGGLGGAAGAGGAGPGAGGQTSGDGGPNRDVGTAGNGGSGSGGQAGGSGGRADASASGGAGGAGGGTGYNPCKASPCVILPLGDSITHGFGSTDDAGYRSGLFKAIVAANQNVTFIGSLTNGPSTVSGKTFPSHHEGHDGITVSGITGYVPPAKSFSTTPHIVLLHIGTNDITNNSDPTTIANQLDTLVTNLVKAAPDALIAVAKIIPLFYSSTTYTNYAAKIPGIVSTHAGKGEHVVMVDMTSFPSNDFGNGVHPSDQGYVFMANLWYGAIKDYLPN
jgi:lysophospholipase L1-like esterase